MAKKNDFFNLNSDEDEEEEEDQVQTKINKWDWTNEENYSLYFSKNEKRNSTKILDAENMSNKSIKHSHSQQSSSSRLLSAYNEPKHFLERVENNSNSDKLLFNLVGHIGSVNRVHWTKRYNLKNFLLSSSMDR